MKKLLMLAITSLLFFSAKAQVGQTCIVTNHTTCDVYYQLWGDPNGTCAGAYQSAFYTLAPGNSASYDGTALGLKVGDDFIGAGAWNTLTASCPAVANYVGDACWTPNTTTPSYSSLYIGSSCLYCHDMVAVWSPGVNPGEVNLDFY
ncbi:MAG: hypothetical protein JST82_10955 [Bacteroidetes bacterium]|nr:hypothetical protein [Bacteroidota bacterium]